MFVFQKIWHALLSLYLRFEIRLFPLLPTNYDNYLDGAFRLKDLLGLRKRAKNLLQLKILSSLFYFKFLILDENTKRQ